LNDGTVNPAPGARGDHNVVSGIPKLITDSVLVTGGMVIFGGYLEPSFYGDVWKFHFGTVICWNFSN
jgi:hypothetical protein